MIEKTYKASITREQFYFYEMRTVSKLLLEGLSKEEVFEKIVSENLFQYPTERTISRAAKCCLSRIDSVGDDSIIKLIAERPSEVAKQACLYAMMKQHYLVWDFMITVIGAKYREFDLSYGKRDLNAFIMRLQEQNESVAAWTDDTTNKVKQVLNRILLENDYIDSLNATTLNPVLIDSELENLLRSNNDEAALIAFNRF